MKKMISIIPLLAICGPLAAQEGTIKSREVMSQDAAMHEIELLKARLEQLEAQVKQNRSAIAVTQAEMKESFTEAPVMIRNTFNDNARAAARIDNTVYGDDTSGFFKLPNTDSVLRIGGYIKMDMIYDRDPVGDKDQFLVSELPASGADDQFHMHIKQTRINFELRRPTDNYGPLRILIENDFFGSNDSTNYRLRHAYAQLGNVLGGYTYSTLVDADALPNTLDFAGPGGAIYLLTPQLRLSTHVTENTNVSFAIERPASEIDYSGGPVDGAESTPLPEFIARGRWETDMGHLQLGAVVRKVAYDDGDLDDDVTGYGGALSGAVKTFGDDSLQFSIAGGEGIGHYFSDLNGGNSDAAFDSHGKLAALRSAGGFVAYQHFWSERWNSSLVYGLLDVDNEMGQLDDALHRDEYGSINLIWSPTRTFSTGVEVLHGKLEHKDGSEDEATRIQLSFQASLLR